MAGGQRGGVCKDTPARPSVSRLSTQWLPPFLQHCWEETLIDQGAYLIFPNSEKLKANACPSSFVPDRGSGGQETQMCSAWWVQPERHCLHINYGKTLLAAPPMRTVSDCHCVPNEKGVKYHSRTTQHNYAPPNWQGTMNSQGIWKPRQTQRQNLRPQLSGKKISQIHLKRIIWANFQNTSFNLSMTAQTYKEHFGFNQK